MKHLNNLTTFSISLLPFPFSYPIKRVYTSCSNIPPLKTRKLLTYLRFLNDSVNNSNIRARQAPALTSNANRTVTSNLKPIHFRRDLENELIWKQRSFLMFCTMNWNNIVFFFPFLRRMSLWQRAERARLDVVPRSRSAIRKNVLHQVWMCSSKYSSEFRIFFFSWLESVNSAANSATLLEERKAKKSCSASTALRASQDIGVNGAKLFSAPRQFSAYRLITNICTMRFFKTVCQTHFLPPYWFSILWSRALREKRGEHTKPAARQILRTRWSSFRTQSEKKCLARQIFVVTDFKKFLLLNFFLFPPQKPEIGAEEAENRRTCSVSKH